MFIVLHGEDDFSSREYLAKLLHDPRFVNNVERFDGPGGSLEAIRQACETFPFLSEGRLVVVDGLPKPKRESATKAAPADAASGTKSKRGAKKPSAAAQAKEFAGALAELGAHLPTITTLVIIVAEDLPKVHPLLEVAGAEVRLFAPPTGAALERWISGRAKVEQASITPEAVRLLASLANGQPRLLANEIAKLATYVDRGGTIDAAVVELLVPDSREARVFDLTDALARGERGPALRLLHELLGDGQQPLMILAMIARQVRVLAQVKDLAARGARPPEIASKVGMAPFLVEKTLNQARHFTLPQIEAAQRACLDVDAALKRSRMAPDMALDLLLTEFGHATTVT
ncbi:MAG: DNA polymerase III subunit delta [Ktedonobacterales bacterium]|nr:DNA polymerase III subunit delta [Ktedonobacterales bacterium]